VETALVSLGVIVGAGIALGVPRPPARWLWAACTGAGLAFLLNLYLNPGTPLPAGALLGRSPTLEGAAYGILLALRLVVGMAAAWVLARALPAERAADGIARVLSPLRWLGVPADPLRAGIGLALRFAPLVRDEGERIARIQEARAGGPPQGLLERLERARAVLVPLLVCTLERAERVALALEARHYRGRVPMARESGTAWGPAAAGAALAAWGMLWRS
jgi:energy-coupling factor transport system permease protein